MRGHLFLSIIASLLISRVAPAEKVLFGQPAPLESRQEPDAAAKGAAKPEGRKGRVFAFPSSQQQDSRTHQPGYVISSPHYDVTEDRFAQAGAAEALPDENRLLSFLPSFGADGMQVGLDFKLPFFSIPYAKMFSALSAPSIGGIFGSSSAYGGPAAPSGAVSSNLLGSGSGLSSSLATMAAMAVTAGLLYPKISNIFSLNGKGVFRDGSGTDDFFQNMNSVLNQFNIDGESCMKVALCSLGNAKRQFQRTRGRDSSGSTTPADVVDDVLNLPAVKSMLSKGGLVQARDFGGTGGDCDFYNAKNKCPVSSDAFYNMFSKLA